MQQEVVFENPHATKTIRAITRSAEPTVLQRNDGLFADTTAIDYFIDRTDFFLSKCLTDVLTKKMPSPPDGQARPRICLNMIVKNESNVLRRCLDPLIGIVDYVAISDTGSTDSTVETITSVCTKARADGRLIDFKVFHHTWKNFGVNRTLSAHAAQQWLLSLHEADTGSSPPPPPLHQQETDGPEGTEDVAASSPPWRVRLPALNHIALLFLDADMKFWIHPTLDEQAFRILPSEDKARMHTEATENPFVMEAFKRFLLEHPMSLVYQYSSAIIYPNVRFVRADTWIICHGPTHEYYSGRDAITGEAVAMKDLIRNCSIEDIGDGGSKADKYSRDIRLLREALEDDPQNVRYWFYLANSYKNAGNLRDAIDAYKKRIALQGWNEEIFMSHIYMGECYEILSDSANALFSYLQGYQALPSRSESLYRASMLTRKMGMNSVSRMIALEGKKIPKPTYAALFLETQVYNYLFDEELSISSFYVGDHETGRKACERIIDDPLIPDAHRKLAQSNLKFYTKTP